jgi:hypothetical protein
MRASGPSNWSGYDIRKRPGRQRPQSSDDSPYTAYRPRFVQRRARSTEHQALSTRHLDQVERLTRRERGSTIVVMRVRAAAFVALMVMAGVVTSALATCVAGAMTPVNAQMACCKGGHQKCGPSGSASDCCKKSEPRPQQLAMGKADPAASPLRALLLTFTAAQPHLLSVAVRQTPRGFSRGPTLASSPPHYLVFSVFLI